MDLDVAGSNECQYAKQQKPTNCNDWILKDNPLHPCTSMVWNIINLIGLKDITHTSASEIDITITWYSTHFVQNECYTQHVGMRLNVGHNMFITRGQGWYLHWSYLSQIPSDQGDALLIAETIFQGQNGNSLQPYWPPVVHIHCIPLLLPPLPSL